MSKIVIEGGKKLCGKVDVQGAKNSVLPLLAATFLVSGSSVLHNCPNIADVDTAVEILESLGSKVVRSGGDIFVDSSAVAGSSIPELLMRKMRSSVVFLGAILGRMGEASISAPGGCELGPRPIDLHISSLEALGAEVCECHGNLCFKACGGLIGGDITLAFPSVGATENIILAAAISNGTATIRNAAREPEICDLANFINSAGGNVLGAGSDKIVIKGVAKLHSLEHTVIPDRIVAATYMSAAAVSGGDILINKVCPEHMSAVAAVFAQSGCEMRCGESSLRIKAPNKLKSVSYVKSLVHPGFPTDSGPAVTVMLSKAQGTSLFIENIFENRFRYIDELKRFGAKIKTEGRVAVIEGCENLYGASCVCCDLRAGAALALAGFAAEGKTILSDVYHIERGYENFTQNFKSLGADIKYRK